MYIEIIAIATEVLKGFTVNTNAAFISETLLKSGFKTSKHLAIEDRVELISEELEQALKRSDIIITTGGLGPTLDDLTRVSFAKVFKCGFTFNQQVADHLTKRYGQALLSLKDQATIPELAQPILNLVGTAPGLIFEQGRKTVIALPGVPLEMEAMIPAVMDFLKQKYPTVVRAYGRSIHLFGLTESLVDPVLRTLSKTFPAVDYGIYPSQGLLTVRLGGQNSDELEQAQLILKEKFHDHLFESSNGTIETAIQELFVKHHLTLSLAESCTGGSIAAGLTQFSGASKYFVGGVVSYSNEMKRRCLGVPEQVIHHYGAVSEETALAMAKGVLELADSDFSLAVTGIAGPLGGLPEKPIGTVFGAVMAKNGKSKSIKLLISRPRNIVIERTKNLMLAELYRFVSLGFF